MFLKSFVACIFLLLLSTVTHAAVTEITVSISSVLLSQNIPRVFPIQFALTAIFFPPSSLSLEVAMALRRKNAITRQFLEPASSPVYKTRAKMFRSHAADRERAAVSA